MDEGESTEDFRVIAAGFFEFIRKQLFAVYRLRVEKQG